MIKPAAMPVAGNPSQMTGLKRFVTHTCAEIGNKSESLLQNPDMFKTNALIFSSLALVLSRIAVSKFSAIKARGTSEEPFREREAIRTELREIGGFTFSFIVLRMFQNALKSMMQKAYGIKETGGAKPYPVFNKIRLAFKERNNPAFHLEKRPDFGLDSMPRFEYDAGKSKTLIGQMNWVRQKLGKPRIQPEHEMKWVKGLYEWGPIGVGSIVAMVLGGYALERFTQDHSNDAINFFTKYFGGKDDKEAEAKPATYLVGLPQPNPFTAPAPLPSISLGQPLPATPAPIPVGLNGFVDRVQQRQQARSMVSSSTVMPMNAGLNPANPVPSPV